MPRRQSAVLAGEDSKVVKAAKKAKDLKEEIKTLEKEEQAAYKLWDKANRKLLDMKAKLLELDPTQATVVK